MDFAEDKEGNLILDDGTIIPKEKRQKTEVYSRVVGFLRPVSQYNPGKKQEFKERATFDANENKH